MATSIALARGMAIPTSLDQSESVAMLENTTPSAAAKDLRRTWLWGFLAILAVSQLYFVRELVAAFALFAIAFVAIAIAVVAFYMLVKCGELAFTRLAHLRRPAMQLSRMAGHSRKPA